MRNESEVDRILYIWVDPTKTKEVDSYFYLLVLLALLCLEWLTDAVRVDRLVHRLFLVSRRTQCCLDHSDG